MGVWLGQDDNRKAHHVAGAAEWRFRAKVPRYRICAARLPTAYRRRVQMIFQNPYEALDPRYTILEAVMEPLAIHGIGNARDRRLAAKQMLEKVDLRPTGISRTAADLSAASSSAWRSPVRWCSGLD